MKQIAIVLCLSAALALSVSCSESLLNIPQLGVQSEANSYITDEDCDAATAAVYAAWRHAWSGTGSSSAIGTTFCNLFWFKNLLSDEFNPGSQTYQTDLASYTYTNANPWIGAIYEFLYGTVYYANIVIDNFKPESETKTRCIAEAKFFRGYAHLHLAALWGETVPMVDHLLNTDEYHVGHSEPGKVWELVENDLKASIAVLPSKKNVNDQTQMRITKEAAEVYLGNAYLWQKKYKEAAAEYEKVIGSGLYKLWDGEFENLTHVPANNCCEKVLEAQVHNSWRLTVPQY